MLVRNHTAQTLSSWSSVPLHHKSGVWTCWPPRRLVEPADLQDRWSFWYFLSDSANLNPVMKSSDFCRVLFLSVNINVGLGVWQSLEHLPPASVYWCVHPASRWAPCCPVCLPRRLHHVSEDQRRFRGGDEGRRDDPGHLGAHQGQTHLPVPGDGPAQVRGAHPRLSKSQKT